jgi:hypothetical protein
MFVVAPDRSSKYPSRIGSKWFQNQMIENLKLERVFLLKPAAAQQMSILNIFFGRAVTNR